MPITIPHRFSRLREGLLTLDKHRIGKAVLAIVLLLDLFILISIFDGLGDHTRQLVSPQEFIPSQCRDIVLDKKWNQDSRLLKTANSVNTKRTRYRQHANDDGDKQLEEQHPTCSNLSALLRGIAQDGELSDQLSEFLRLRTHSAEIKVELERTRGAYNTELFEVMAKQPNAEPRPNLKQQVNSNTLRLNGLAQQEAETIETLQAHDSIQRFNTAIDSVSSADRDQLLSDLREANFWYPVKRLAMELLFLLPLITIFYLWNRRSLAGSRPYQTLISSHLLVVAFVPVLFKILELVYDLLPKKFLQQLFALLESLNLLALWHYFVMGGAIAGALVMIYVMQKKVFSPQKLVQKRISKCQCQKCGYALGRDDLACSDCGYLQFKPCSSCKRPTYVNGSCCRICGAGST